MSKYIFLDFDGVLNISGKKSFYRAQHFADTIKDLDNLFVVFSTSWREYTPTEKLAELMPKSIRDKCIGKTPYSNNTASPIRYNEILAYTKTNDISNKQWVALDDMAILFPKDCKNLILTNHKIGFSKREADLIRNFYETNIF